MFTHLPYRVSQGVLWFVTKAGAVCQLQKTSIVVRPEEMQSYSPLFYFLFTNCQTETKHSITTQFIFLSLSNRNTLQITGNTSRAYMYTVGA